MNLSGESVRELADFYKVTPNEIIVIYDDVSLEVGQLRIRKKGSAGGHNGMKSIIAHLGTDEFPRIKVGIGDKPKDWDLADYVLSRFQGEEQPAIRDALKNSSDACRMIITSGIDAAMNQYNRRIEKNSKLP
jgi:PTH1 family peptidyl-tRNA hydrolase